MAPLRISFILRSVYDLLPSNANLVKWGKSEDPSCPLCNGRQTVEHVLSSCNAALTQGRYTWRHNQVLKVLANAVQFNATLFNSIKNRTRHPEPETVFLTAGSKKTWPTTTTNPLQRSCKRGLLGEADDWECAAEIIHKSGLRSDIGLHSQKAKQILLIELTVPYESRIEESHVYKNEKYADLAIDLRKDGF